MSTYHITSSLITTPQGEGTLLRLSFGSPANNDQIVRDAIAAIQTLNLAEGGGRAIVLLNGPASLPVAAAVTHAVAHLFGAVGCFDPKLGAGGSYVVAVAHGGGFAVGDLIPAASVIEATPAQ